MDNAGRNTYCTALDTQRLMNERHWQSVIIVSDFSHLSRCKLAFRRFGMENFSAAHSEYYCWADAQEMFREFFAYYWYWIRTYPNKQ